MTFAQRVRDRRFAKGWGPDELATRASISRTALYQIESGRTEHPRASTVRRIAEALDIPIEELLMPDLGVVGEGTWPVAESMSPGRPPAPGAAPAPPNLEPVAPLVRVRFEATAPAQRERELERKLRELLASPLGEGLARILEESYRLLPRNYVESGC